MSNVGVRSQKTNETRLVELIEEAESAFIDSLKPTTGVETLGFDTGAGNQGPGSPNNPTGNFLPLDGGQMTGPIALLHEFHTLATDGILDATKIGAFSGRVILLPNSGTTDDLIGIKTEQGITDQGRHLEIVVTSADTITIKNQDPGALAGDRITTPGGVDLVVNGAELDLVYDFSTSSWVLRNSVMGADQWSLYPALGTVLFGNNALEEVSSIEIVDTGGEIHGILQGLDGVPDRVRLTLVAGNELEIVDNITSILQLSLANGLDLQNLDLTMGTGNIVAGGAGEGATNIGHLDFIDNLATPVASVSLYSDGVDLFANTGGGTVNLSDITAHPNEFEDNVFRVIDELDNTKKLQFNIGLAVPTATTVTWRAQAQGGEVAFTDVTQTFLGEITFTNSLHNIYSSFITLGDTTSDNLFINAGLNTPLRWDVGASSPVGTAEFGIGRDGTKMEIAVPVGSTFGFNVGGATDIFTLQATIASFTVPLTMGTNSITAGGAGEGITNIGVLTFIDNLATPGAGVALYSDGVDLFSKSSINLNLNNLNDVTDLVLRSGFNTSKLFFDGGGDTYFTGSGTSGRINIFNDNTNTVALGTSSIELFGAHNLIFNSGYIQMNEQVSDPLAGTTSGKFYVKVVGGNAEPWFIGDGTVATSLLGGGGGSQTPILSDIDYDNFDAFDMNKLLFISTGGFSFPADINESGFTWDGINLQGNVPAGDGFLLSVAGVQKFGVANTVVNSFTDLDINGNNLILDGTVDIIYVSGGTHFRSASNSFFFRDSLDGIMYSVSSTQWDFNDKHATGLNEVRFEDDKIDHLIREMSIAEDGIKGLDFHVEEDIDEEFRFQHEGVQDLNALRIRQREASPSSATDGLFKYVWHNNGIHYFPLGGGMVIDSTVADGYEPTYGTLKIPFQSSSVTGANMDSFFGSIPGSIAIMNGSGSSPRFCVRSSNGNWYQVAITLIV